MLKYWVQEKMDRILEYITKFQTKFMARNINLWACYLSAKYCFTHSKGFINFYNINLTVAYWLNSSDLRQNNREINLFFVICFSKWRKVL